MSNPIKIAVAGLGTVGIGVLKVVSTHRDTLKRRAGRGIEVVAVSARDRHRDRGFDVSGFAWCDNPVDLAATEADIVVELIGGSDGPALTLARATLAAGKSFVTANKALIAHHGTELAMLAEENGAALRFEAAVAGGIPIIKAIREGLAANAIESVSGILNGTCNYILTTMEKEGRNFDDVLEEAQELGYAEADPSFDIDGVDAAHKTAILAALAFGTPVNFDALPTEGIRHVTSIDINYARELGYRVKLLGVARRINGGIEQRVHPCMVPLSSPIAQVDDAYNAVIVQGDFVEQSFYQGKGAGEGPTASAVVADIIDIARGDTGPAFSVAATDLVAAPVIDAANHVGRFYIRLRVTDEPGVMADIACAFRDETVSVESLIQHGHADEGGVYFILATHETTEQRVTAVLDYLGALDSVLDAPVMIRILDN